MLIRPQDPPSLSYFRTAARGLEAQRLALGAATDNIANATTSRAEDGEPYAVRRAVHTAEDGGFRSRLVEAKTKLRATDARHIGNSRLRSRLQEEAGPRTDLAEIDAERLEYDPDHPHADADGYVHYPDVNVVDEMARMISANRIYEANLTSVKAAKEMIKRSLEI